MNRRELGQVLTGGLAVAAVADLALIEESCAFSGFGFAADLLAAISAGVGAAATGLEALGIPPGILALVQAGLNTATTFVKNAETILADTALTSLQKIEQILELGPAVLQALGIPGIPAALKMWIDIVVSAVNAFLAALAASKATMTSSTAKAHAIVSSAAMSAFEKPTRQDRNDLARTLYRNRQAEILVAALK
jgi:hypothetical protein